MLTDYKSARTEIDTHTNDIFPILLFSSYNLLINSMVNPRSLLFCAIYELSL